MKTNTTKEPKKMQQKPRRCKPKNPKSRKTQKNT